MALPFFFRHRLRFPELQTLGGAGGHAGGFQALVDPILAIIAFDHLAYFRLPLRRAPGAGGNAGLATDTKVVVNKDNAITRSLLHGACGAGGHAPRVLAMKAGHENERGSRQAADHFRADLDDLAQTRALLQIFVGFALDFAGMAANAFASILGEMVPAHENSPFDSECRNEESNLQNARIPHDGVLEKFFTRSMKKFSGATYSLVLGFGSASSMPNPIYKQITSTFANPKK